MVTLPASVTVSMVSSLGVDSPRKPEAEDPILSLPDRDLDRLRKFADLA